ncbi:MAG: hypothetical protein WBG86_02955 [Polyangiales bacterium]
MKLLSALGAATLMLVVACGDGTAPAPKRPAIPDTLTNCDITEAGCQLGIFESVAELLEQDSTDVPPIRTISVAQFEEETRSGFSEDDFTGDDPATRGLRLVGFLPDAAGSALEDAIDLRISSVAAYYNSRDRAITVIDRDYDEGFAQTILAHEFVHAFQDIEFGISEVFRGADTTDAVMGARTVIEGDAQYASFAWYYEQEGIDLTSIDWEEIYTSFQESAKQAAEDLSLSIDASAGTFPYAYGIDLLGNATQAQGLPGRAAFFMATPQSALDAMLGYEGFVAQGFTPIDAPTEALSTPVDGSELSIEDRAGAWYVYATLLRAGYDESAAWAGAIQWRGDRLGVFESGSEVVAVWRVRVQDDPAFLVDAIAGTMRDVSWSAQADGSDVYVIAAESDQALATWEAQPLSLMAAMVAAAPDVRKGLLARETGGCSPPPPPPR